MGMNIWDSRDRGSTIILDVDSSTTLASGKECLVVSAEDSQLIVDSPTVTEVVSLGDGQYLRGEKGETGEEPEHEWQGTSLRFRRPDGSWGWLVDLKGDTGGKGDQGIQGPQGEGIQGLQGPAGPTKFVWAKYADSTTPPSNEMYNDPTGRVYVGIAYNREVEEGTGDPQEFDYTQYAWSKIQGTDGTPGTPGQPGDTGPAGTGFTWIGEWAEHPTEEDIGRPLADGDTYLNLTDQKVYTYAGGWHTMIESGGEGPIGPQGAPGGGFQYQGEFSSSPSGALVNWLYLNINDDLFYVYDGSAWTVATSDGKDSTDGAECGNGLRFFTTYNASETQPPRPTLDGDTNGWDPNPHSFEPGDIKWVSQKIATEPELGAWNDALDISAHGFRGPVGFRGSQSIMLPIPGWNGIWSDEIAAQACTGGAPQEWDVVTEYKSEDPEVQITKRWAFNAQNSIWEWLDYNYVFLGDVLVDGTVDGTAFNAKTTITAGETAGERAYMSGDGDYRFWSGNDDPVLAPFWVDKYGNGKFSGTLVLGGEEITDRDELIGNELRSIFINGTSTPVTPPNGYPPAGWTTNPTSAAVGEKTYTCIAYFDGTGAQTESWSTPAIFGGNPADGTDGEDGTNGTNGRELRSVYISSVADPGRPSGTAYPPAGWSVEPTDPSVSDRVWISTAWFLDDVMSDTQWGTPSIFSGLDGSEYDDTWIYPNQDNLSIKSEVYTSGVTGWAIDAIGNAEFNNAVVRGDLFADTLTFPAGNVPTEIDNDQARNSMKEPITLTSNSGEYDVFPPSERISIGYQNLTSTPVIGVASWEVMPLDNDNAFEIWEDDTIVQTGLVAKQGVWTKLSRVITYPANATESTFFRVKSVDGRYRAREGKVDSNEVYPEQSSKQISGGGWVDENSTTGWGITKAGNAYFNNGTFRGTLDGADGNFSGTVEAEKIIGDVAKPHIVSANSNITIPAEDYDRVLVTPTLTQTKRVSSGASSPPQSGTASVSITIGGTTWSESNSITVSGGNDGVAVASVTPTPVTIVAGESINVSSNQNTYVLTTRK